MNNFYINFNMLDFFMKFFGIIYLPIVLSYNYYYDNRKKHNVTYSIFQKKINKYYFYWNLSLSLFSFWGTYNTLPIIINSIYLNGLNNTIKNYDLWSLMTYPGLLFAPSKIMELGDTFFIMLKGKRIRFIQYFHHWITMLYCWHAHYYIPGGINVNAMFCSMNYTVHSFMYSWYAMSAIGIVTPVWIKNMITKLQIIQMFFGFYMCCIANLYGKWYINDYYGSLFGTNMYLFYCILFTNFYFKIKSS